MNGHIPYSYSLVDAAFSAPLFYPVAPNPAMNFSSFIELLELHADVETITGPQMALRAVLVFAAALAMLRLAGPRTFGRDTAFDLVLKITLGSLLARAVVAASPFWPTLLACAVFVGLHRLLAWLAYHYKGVGWLIKGQSTLLAQEGQQLDQAMRQNHITENELVEGLREAVNTESLDKAQTVWLERSGKISVVQKPED